MNNLPSLDILSPTEPLHLHAHKDGQHQTRLCLLVLVSILEIKVYYSFSNNYGTFTKNQNTTMK